MSDLFCPATLIVTRHGQATYHVPGIASDDGGWLTELGRKQASALARSHGGAISLTVPRLATNVPADYARGRSLDNCASCELGVDSDGWVLRTWAGEAV